MIDARGTKKGRPDRASASNREQKIPDMELTQLLAEAFLVLDDRSQKAQILNLTRECYHYLEEISFSDGNRALLADPKALS
jgi:hypothetical protein